MVNYHYEEIQVFKGPSCRGLSNIGWEDNMKQTLKRFIIHVDPGD